MSNSKVHPSRSTFVLLSTLILFTSLSVAQSRFAGPQHSRNDSLQIQALVGSVDSLRSQLALLGRELEMVRVSKDYFSTILNSQTAIFSTIVVLFAGITWIFSYFRIKEQIRSEMATARADIAKLKQALVEANSSYIDAKLADTQNVISNLGAALSRAFASMHHEKPNVSFIWWLRAASEYTPDQKELIEAALTSAYAALQKLSYRVDISSTMTEISDLLASVDQNQYQLQIKLIRGEVERVYKTDIASPKPATT